jgi:transcriptional regulator with XRE-family HTH domain
MANGKTSKFYPYSEEVMHKSIGNNLGYFRKDRKLTVPMLSSRTGICDTTIYKIENGTYKNMPTLMTLMLLANALEVKIGDLFGEWR